MKTNLVIIDKILLVHTIENSLDLILKYNLIHILVNDELFDFV